MTLSVSASISRFGCQSLCTAWLNQINQITNYSKQLDLSADVSDNVLSITSRSVHTGVSFLHLLIAIETNTQRPTAITQQIYLLQ